MRRLWNRIKENKKSIRLLIIMVFAVSLLISGVSLAYFTSQDKVVNRHRAASLGVQLFEPNWNNTGSAMAETMEPGMLIPKDPYLYNYSDTKVYVRMRLELADSEGSTISESDERYLAIIDAIYYDKAATTVLLENGVSQNPDFYYYNGWFYYAAKETGCTILYPGQRTSKLFNILKIPVLKSDYIGIFDTDFTINVIGQCISTEKIDDGTTDFKTIEKAFE